MNLRILATAALLATTLAFSLKSTASAQSEIVWKPLPGTQSLPSREDPNPEPWVIGINTITRRGDAINFDVVEGFNYGYARYFANCRTGAMTPILMGAFGTSGLEAGKVQEDYFQAVGVYKLALKHACSQR